MTAIGTGLPAGIGLSQVRVYRSQAPDGQCGGTPHLHLACTELYVVVRGNGAAEFLTESGLQRVPLGPGAAVQFTPGTVHRLVNGADPLDVLVIMENGRLNEEGDVVFAFPDADLTDPTAYAELATATDLAAVEHRRDRAVLGFRQRADLWAHDPPRALEEIRLLHRRAAQLVQERARTWPQIIADGPAQALDQLTARVASVQTADPTHLGHAEVTVLPRFDDTDLTPKMCGVLWSYAPQTQTTGKTSAPENHPQGP